MTTTPRKRHIGYIGVGAMGGGMAAHLLSNGYPLSVYDVDPEAVDRLVRKGALAAASPKEAAERSELVITCLPSTDAVEEAALGDDGVVAGMSPGQIYIDMSTMAPETTRKLGAAVAQKQGHMLDVPLGKGPDEAATGDLSLMVGGDPTVVERCANVLDTVATTRFYCGELGTGVTVKIVNNLVSCGVSTLRAGVDQNVDGSPSTVSAATKGLSSAVPPTLVAPETDWMGAGICPESVTALGGSVSSSNRKSDVGMPSTGPANAWTFQSSKPSGSPEAVCDVPAVVTSITSLAPFETRSR